MADQDDEVQTPDDEESEMECDAPPKKQQKVAPADAPQATAVAPAKAPAKAAVLQTTAKAAAKAAVAPAKAIPRPPAGPPPPKNGNLVQETVQPMLGQTPKAAPIGGNDLQSMWAPPPPPPGMQGLYPKVGVAKPFPPNVFIASGQAIPKPPAGGPPPAPAKELTRKEKNALKPNRGSGRLGKWCSANWAAKRAPTDVLEAFYRLNPQPANAEEGHRFVAKMPEGQRFDLSKY